MKNKSLFFIFFILGVFGFSQMSVAFTPDITVALDGCGDYTKIQDAIDAAPSNESRTTIILVKAGLYDTEKLIVPAHKTNITLLGESRDQTIISYHIYDCPTGKCPAEDAEKWTGDNIRTSATLSIHGDGFRAENLTIQNTAGPVGQAPAITIRGDTWNMSYAPTSADLHLYEYQNTGPGADMSGRANWVGLRAMTDEEALTYTVQDVLGGTDGVSTVIDAHGDTFLADLNLSNGATLNITQSGTATYIAGNGGRFTAGSEVALNGQMGTKETNSFDIDGVLTPNGKGRLRMRGAHQSTGSLTFEGGNRLSYATSGTGFVLDAPIIAAGDFNFEMSSSQNSSLTLKGTISGSATISVRNTHGSESTTATAILLGENSG